MSASKLIKGKNIVLRPYTQKDFKLIHQWVINPQVTKVTGEPVDISLSKLTKSYKEKIKGNYYLLFMIDFKNITIGYCNIFYHYRNPKSKIVDIGICIGEMEYWGKGLGKDTLTTLMNYAFDILNMEETTVTYNLTNKRMKGLATKIGFKKTKWEIESAKITKENFRETDKQFPIKK